MSFQIELSKAQAWIGVRLGLCVRWGVKAVLVAGIDIYFELEKVLIVK